MVVEKELISHLAIGVRQLSVDGFCLLLHRPERGLGSLKAFLESF
jgi:hypothetical protein